MTPKKRRKFGEIFVIKLEEIHHQESRIACLYTSEFVNSSIDVHYTDYSNLLPTGSPRLRVPRVSAQESA